ncbi:DUF3298 and DUF4163 domain-containing protein [Chitinophaga cymbidii]|uniref:DUF3298 domain-containing protein n=1 Tax=Chitinophaga cymbidii TaxID=1096750 RepID=A0A512RHT7_9BACT|nr:DUF3298 and DUF4163 domain-containing protein [Chitinophaga cymbidii]GEP95258.1 hypothetical protein CCY01nite_15180 [Chitinophaga cymbidii]
MRTYACLLASLLCFAACQQPAKQPSASQDTTATATPLTQRTAFYTQLKGMLAGQPVTMQLIRYGNAQYEGWYYYDKTGDPIPLYYQQDSSGQITLVENSDPDENQFFTGKLTDDGHFKGIWKGSRQFEFDFQEDKKDAVLFDVFSFSDSANLFYNDPRSPMALASAGIVWPVGGADEAALAVVRQFIGQGLNNPDSIVKAPVDSFLLQYKQNRDEVDTNELKSGMGASWNWNAETRTRIVWNQYPLLVLESASYEFTGGAHGNYGSIFSVIDLSRKKVLKPADVFKPGYEKAIGQALEASFRKKYKVPAGEALSDGFLFEKNIRPNDNFFITSKGVTFCYTPYEIAAYVFGQINLFVPFNDVKDFVNEAYLQ